MRLAVCVLLALLVAACGSAEPGAGVERYGISLGVPPGWHGAVTRARIRFATGDLSVTLSESEPAAWNRAEEAYFRDDTRHPGLWDQNALRAAPPYRSREFVRRDCPGKACEVPEYLLVAAYGDRYRVEIRLYFGRPDPTDAMRAEADAMLAGLEFPDWGPWELDAA